MKCIDCPHIMVVDLNWPYCKILSEYITLEKDFSCHFCPIADYAEHPAFESKPLAVAFNSMAASAK